MWLATTHCWPMPMVQSQLIVEPVIKYQLLLLPQNDLPSARLSHKGGATTRPKGLVRNIKVDPESSNPPDPWNSWDEYLQDKPQEFTPDQIVGVVAQNQCKINRSIPRILELFDWYSSSRMVSVIGHFDCHVGSEAKGGEGQRWKRALMDLAYRNITFDMKQLVEVLRYDLQVTIQEGLIETQTELLETIAGFIDHFQMEMITLSPPQMHTLLDHLRARQAGGQALLDVIRHGNTSTWPESFLDKGPSHLLQSFFDSLTHHQVDIKRGFNSFNSDRSKSQQCCSCFTSTHDRCLC